MKIIKNHLGRLLRVNHSLRQLLDEFCVQRVDGSLVHADGGDAVGVRLNGNLGKAGRGGAEVGRRTGEASAQVQCQPSTTEGRHAVKSGRIGLFWKISDCIVSILYFGHMLHFEDSLEEQ